MKNNWQTKELGEVLEYEQPTPYIVSSKNYKEEYETPVLTAGKSFILGKTKEKSGIFPKDKLPVIIFDDFTTATQFVDFPFKVKSSAMKILHPVKKISNAKFIFYLIQTINFNYKGIHKRYWISEYSKIKILLPPLLEQRRIVKILDEAFKKIEKARENAEKNIKNAKELFESYLQSIFTGAKDKWDENKLGEICSVINRGVSPKYIETGGLCVLNQKCIRGHKVNFELSRLHDFKNKKIGDEKFIQIGDVLINSTGTGTLGRVAQVKELKVRATVDSHITIVRPMENKFYNDFFGYALIYIEKEIAKRGEGCGGQTELARNTLKNNFSVSYPKSLSEQKFIVAKLDKLSSETKKLESIYKQKLADLEELKKSILKKAFNGEL